MIFGVRGGEEEESEQSQAPRPTESSICPGLPQGLCGREQAPWQSSDSPKLPEASLVLLRSLQSVGPLASCAQASQSKK